MSERRKQSKVIYISLGSKYSYVETICINGDIYINIDYDSNYKVKGEVIA